MPEPLVKPYIGSLSLKCLKLIGINPEDTPELAELLSGGKLF
jgi:hypothetical protein